MGDLPTILLEINPATGSVSNKYIYANGQIIMRHGADNYFYLHDRLGSVRQIINSAGNVVQLYTFNPFGEVLESSHGSQAPSNCFMFTGQYFDYEIDEYYLRARQYDPYIYRFTSRDPILGDFKEPLALHAYLYCLNDPINLIDPNGVSSRALRAYNVQPWTFEQWMALWNAKLDPFETKMVLHGLWSSMDFVQTTVIDSPALKVFTAGAGLIQAGPNINIIMYYQMLRHGLINAILYEFFGENPLYAGDLYDYQDYLLGL